MVNKLFVLDTNVILHDSSCIKNFENNDVAIPITVLEELDNFKRGNQDINYQAREFLRTLDELSGNLISSDGIPLGENLGSIRVVFGGSISNELKQAFFQDSPDHRILNVIIALKKTEKQTIILVTKDTNLRMKAKSLGIISQDYTSDKLESVKELYTGKRVIEDANSNAIDSLYNNQTVSASELPEITDLTPNENFIIRRGSKSALAYYSKANDSFVRIDKPTCYHITPRNAEQTFALHAVCDDKIQLVTLSGKAGTGKTLLALAGALERRTEYRQILLTRPVVPLSNRDIGFLPGDIGAKLAPYMQPLFDNLSVIKHQSGNPEKIQEMLDKEKLLITPLAYIRGRSLQRVYFIVDEAQNLTPHEVKTIITRAGEGTKIIFTGDINQIDQPYLDARSNGLSYLINRMHGQEIYTHVTLEKGERSQLAELASNLL